MIDGVTSGARALVLGAFIAAVSSCSQKPADEGTKAPPKKVEGALLRVGSLVISQADLEQQLKDNHSGLNNDATRKKALDELASRAQFAQAALDADLAKDPVVRAEVARVLASRFKEKTLFPRLKELTAPIPESRLREIYQAAEGTFRSSEKRQVAALWLNPGRNPEREKQYTEKLTAAREFFFKTGNLKDHPEKAFSVLSVDHSEHQASRYRGGVVDWLERGGGSDPWTKALAEIVFSLEKPGDVSAVISRPEGVFLVRYMAEKPAVLRTFETVSGEIERMERQRLREKAEAEFAATIKARYPVETLGSSQ